MRAFDLSPLFSTTVGFDRMARMLEQMPSESAPSYPPYNIRKTGENAYRVSLAVAGFGEDEVTVEVKENLLTVAGKLARENGESESYLHRGIASPRLRAALQPRRSHPGDGARRSTRGCLHIDLVRELPEDAEGAPDRHRDRRPRAPRPKGGLTGTGAARIPRGSFFSFPSMGVRARSARPCAPARVDARPSAPCDRAGRAASRPGSAHLPLLERERAPGA